ncbi:hypothetical protein CPT_Sonora_091 [Stenotrophomonas phage Sonora]|nr:hypothetical protein CPT_Sonora_091 [Stenotrophomonas phage Sonora]
MNYIGWVTERIAVRCIWAREKVAINIGGETFPCEVINPDGNLSSVTVKYDDGRPQEIRIPLGFLNPLRSNSTLYYFDSSYPDGRGGTLFIPLVSGLNGEDDPDAEEEE